MLADLVARGSGVARRAGASHVYKLPRKLTDMISTANESFAGTYTVYYVYSFFSCYYHVLRGTLPSGGAAGYAGYAPA